MDPVRLLARRISLLKAKLATMPGESIPELTFLTDNDWILVANQHPKLDSDPPEVHRALADLLNAAVSNFEPKMAAALKTYVKDSGGRLPASVAQLLPEFDPPVDPAILDRYAMIRSSSTDSPLGSWLIEGNPATAVDQTLDERATVGVGSYGMQGPFADGDVEGDHRHRSADRAISGGTRTSRSGGRFRRSGGPTVIRRIHGMTFIPISSASRRRPTRPADGRGRKNLFAVSKLRLFAWLALLAACAGGAIREYRIVQRGKERSRPHGRSNRTSPPTIPSPAASGNSNAGDDRAAFAGAHVVRLRRPPRRENPRAPRQGGEDETVVFGESPRMIHSWK